MDVVARMTALYCTGEATELTGSHLELKTDLEEAKGLAINMITACETQLKELLKNVRESTTHAQLENIAISVKELGKKLGDNEDANKQFVGRAGTTKRHLMKEERKKKCGSGTVAERRVVSQAAPASAMWAVMSKVPRS